MTSQIAPSPLSGLTILIPVYNAIDETRACLTSLFESDAAQAQVIVMDDGSALGAADALRREFADRDNFRLVTHFRNRGYTRNVAYGIDKTRTPYVCVLNSDTLLPENWAMALLEVLTANPTIAAVGPLSNAASYQSIPEVQDGPGFSTNGNLGADPAERARVSSILGQLFPETLIDVPILNGFCTMFRTAAVRAAGGYDWRSFPSGYGEENDLCIRLAADGHRLVVRPDVFVHHAKSRSFGAERRIALVKKGAATLADLHGTRHPKDLVRQLETNKRLNLIRTLFQLAWPGDQIEPIRGPGRISIASDGTVAVRQDPMVTSIGLALDRSDCLTVALPEHVTLPMVRGAERRSALAYAALLSCSMPVTLDDWQVAAIDPDELTWASALPFHLLYLRPPVPVAEAPALHA